MAPTSSSTVTMESGGDMDVGLKKEKKEEREGGSDVGVWGVGEVGRRMETNGRERREERGKREKKEITIKNKKYIIIIIIIIKKMMYKIIKIKN